MKILVLADDDFYSRWLTVTLASAGHRVCIMVPKTSRRVRLSRHCRDSASCDSRALRSQDGALVERVAAYCREHRVEWVVPADLPAILLLARRSPDLGGARVFPLSEPDLIERLNDKWRLYLLLRELGFPAPNSRLLKSREEARSATLEFPLMIKPLRGEGGRGVQRVGSPSELSGLLDAFGAQFGWPCLVQDFIPGRDIDLSVLADRGRVVAWTIQQRLPEAPDVVEFLEHPGVLKLGSDLVAACRFHGVIHFDMRIDERTNQTLLIEANPRFWGSLRHSVWSGVNFPALGIAMGAGQDVSRLFRPVSGPCRDPGLSVRPLLSALLRGRLRPERWSLATEAAWRCHLSDPIPELWHRLQGRNRVPGNAAALRAE
jgi:biotin carboxylase